MCIFGDMMDTPDQITPANSAPAAENSASTSQTASDTEAFGQALADRESKTDRTVADDTGKKPGSEPRPDGVQKETGKETGTDTASEPPAPKKNSPETGESGKQNNSANAERRIRNKHRYDAMNKRMKELEDELDYYRKYAEEHPEAEMQVRAASQQIQGRMQDMQAMQMDHKFNEYYDTAVRTFGAEGAEKFVADSQRYARQVNEQEPVVRQFINRPYGQILLREWFDRMDVPQNAQEWSQFTDYEKQKALTGIYNAITGAFQRIKERPKQTAAQPPKNVPLPGSGRDSNGTPPADDFALAWQDALNRRK